MRRKVSIKLTSKFPATVSNAVRDILPLTSEDPISDEAYLKGLDQVLDEWNSEEDEKAYQLIP